MNRDFLKEAIADAKAVKESAIANAKIALEEAFNPQLKSMLSAKLEEMDKSYEEDDVTTEAEDEISEETIDENISEEKEEMDEEMDLEEILNELEKSEKSLEEGDIPEGPSPEEEEASQVYEAEEDEAEESTEEEEDDIDIEDMSEDDLKKFIEDVIGDMVESGELEAGEEAEEAGDEMDVDMDDMDIDVEDEEEEETVTEEEIEVDEEMKDELNEAYATINSLKSELQEINLLNAKLLYSNKIFKASTLSESQKVKVLGTFDKATTVKEVKLVFETINENLKVKTPKRISESMIGSASRATSTPKRTKQPIIESDAMVSRFQKLAGITKL